MPEWSTISIRELRDLRITHSQPPHRLRRRRLPGPLRTRTGNVQRDRYWPPVQRLPRQHLSLGVGTGTGHLRGATRVVHHQHQQLRDLRITHSQPPHRVRRWRLPGPLRTRTGDVQRDRYWPPVQRLPRQHLSLGVGPRTGHLRGATRVVHHQHQQLRDLRITHSQPPHRVRRWRLPGPLRARTGDVHRDRYWPPVQRLPRQHLSLGVGTGAGHLRGAGRVVHHQHQQLRDLRITHPQPPHRVRRWRLPGPLRARTGDVHRDRYWPPMQRLPRQHLSLGFGTGAGHLRGAGRVVHHQHQQLRDLRITHPQPPHRVRRWRLPGPLRARTGDVHRDRYWPPMQRLPRQHLSLGFGTGAGHLRGCRRGGPAISVSNCATFELRDP